MSTTAGRRSPAAAALARAVRRAHDRHHVRKRHRALGIDPGRGSLLLFVHKASFVLWFGAMTVHVLAYVLPAARWALADLVGRGPAEVLLTRWVRQAAIVTSLVIGIALSIAGLAWAHPWLTSADFSQKR